MGHLSEGTNADIAIFNLREGEFGFLDVKGFKINGTQKLECELTILEGNVVWDLNGISGTVWEKNP
jgi:dihydroorotase